MAISYVIFLRNPTTGKLAVITNGSDQDVAEYENEADAYSSAEQNPLCRSWGAEIVPIAGIDISPRAAQKVVLTTGDRRRLGMAYQVKYDCGHRGGCGATETASHPAPLFCQHGAPKRDAPENEKP